MEKSQHIKSVELLQHHIQKLELELRNQDEMYQIQATETEQIREEGLSLLQQLQVLTTEVKLAEKKEICMIQDNQVTISRLKEIEKQNSKLEQQIDDLHSRIDNLTDDLEKQDQINRS